MFRKARKSFLGKSSKKSGDDGKKDDKKEPVKELSGTASLARVSSSLMSAEVNNDKPEEKPAEEKPEEKPAESDADKRKREEEEMQRILEQSRLEWAQQQWGGMVGGNAGGGERSWLEQKEELDRQKLEQAAERFAVNDTGAGLYSSHEWVEFEQAVETQSSRTLSARCDFILNRLLKHLKSNELMKFKQVCEAYMHLLRKPDRFASAETYQIMHVVGDKKTSNYRPLWVHIVDTYPDKMNFWRYLLQLFGENKHMLTWYPEHRHSTRREWTPRDYAVYRQRDSLTKICFALEADTMLKRSAITKAEEWHHIESMANVFFKEIKVNKNISKRDAKKCMLTLKHVIIALIKKKLPFSTDLFNFLYLMQRDNKMATGWPSDGNDDGMGDMGDGMAGDARSARIVDGSEIVDSITKEVPLPIKKKTQKTEKKGGSSGHSRTGSRKLNRKTSLRFIGTGEMMEDLSGKSIWKMAELKLKNDIFEFKSLSDSAHHWHWFKRYWMDNPFWIDGERYSDLTRICKEEMRLAEVTLKNDMTQLIDNDLKAWEDLCNRKLDTKFQGSANWRQDECKYGVKPLGGLTEEWLKNITLDSGEYEYDAARSYDFNSYLSRMITLGHMINQPLQKLLEGLMSDDGVVFKMGPVKKNERCKAKAEADYGHAKWPTCARIMDVCRASATYDDIYSLNRGIEKLEKFLTQEQKSIEATCVDSFSIHLEVMRMKNGFKSYRDKTGDDAVPISYKDVKYNLIATTLDDRATKRMKGEKQYTSLICELQLILKPMLKRKLKDHEFYEVLRGAKMMKTSKEMYKEYTLDVRRDLAGTKPQEVAPLFVDHPLSFKFSFGNAIVFAKSPKMRAPFLRVVLERAGAEIWCQKTRDTTNHDRTLLQLVCAHTIKPACQAVWIDHLKSSLKHDAKLYSEEWTKLDGCGLHAYQIALMNQRVWVRSREFSLVKAVPPELAKDIDYFVPLSILVLLAHNKTICNAHEESVVINAIKWTRDQKLMTPRRWKQTLTHRCKKRQYVPVCHFLMGLRKTSRNILRMLTPKFKDWLEKENWWKETCTDRNGCNILHSILYNDHLKDEANADELKICVTNLFSHIDDDTIVNTLKTHRSTSGKNPLNLALWYKIKLNQDLLKLFIPDAIEADFWTKSCITNSGSNLITNALWSKKPLSSEETEIFLHNLGIVLPVIQPKSIIKDFFTKPFGIKKKSIQDWFGHFWPNDDETIGKCTKFIEKFYK